MNSIQVTEAIKCQCGAFTLEIALADGDQQICSMTEDTLEAKIGKDVIAPVLQDTVYSNCNHCVNNWGIDLCACGSGETPDKCENDHEVCGTPMQTLGEAQIICAWG